MGEKKGSQKVYAIIPLSLVNFVVGIWSLRIAEKVALSYYFMGILKLARCQLCRLKNSLNVSVLAGK